MRCVLRAGATRRACAQSVRAGLAADRQPANPRPTRCVTRACVPVDNVAQVRAAAREAAGEGAGEPGGGGCASRPRKVLRLPGGSPRLRLRAVLRVTTCASYDYTNTHVMTTLKLDYMATLG